MKRERIGDLVGYKLVKVFWVGSYLKLEFENGKGLQIENGPGTMVFDLMGNYPSELEHGDIT